MGLLSRLFGARNPVESMSRKDLHIMEIQLTRRIDEIAGEAKKVDGEIALLLEKARSPLSRNEEISLARRIKTLSQKKDMKLAAQAQLDKELRAVSNILILKEHEADLKSAGIWNQVKDLEPDALEDWLIQKNLEGQSRSDLITTITQMTSGAMSTGVEEDDDLDEILGVIRAVQDGSLEPTDVDLTADAGSMNRTDPAIRRDGLYPLQYLGITGMRVDLTGALNSVLQKTIKEYEPRMSVVMSGVLTKPGCAGLLEQIARSSPGGVRLHETRSGVESNRGQVGGEGGKVVESAGSGENEF